VIRVVLVGIGNCASALVQGVAYYSHSPDAPGLIIRDVCGYRPSDIEFVAAFDVDQEKVGHQLDRAIFSGRNNTLRFFKPNTDCVVSAGPVLDGTGSSYRDAIRVVEGSLDSVDETLRKSKADVLINYLPVGSDSATKFWAERCLVHKIGFVNAIPSFVVSDPEWAKKFTEGGIPCAGDDVKSQIGATILHRALVQLFESRGGSIRDTYQLNFGGNMDFFNMLEVGRIESKKISKAYAVQSEGPALTKDQFHISPTGFVKFLGDQKIAYINVSGSVFGGAQIEIECKVKVHDSPNSAGVVIDVVRFVAAARRRGIAGPIEVCPFYFKRPPNNEHDYNAEIVARRQATQADYLNFD
jgi:myo-inositol-1-phosphate synthase